MVVAVTGATGRLGGQVARLLADDEMDVRLVVRDASRAPDIAGADVAIAAYDDPEAVRQALAGVGTALFVSGAESQDRLQQHITFVDAAAGAGVQHVVYTSFIGASPESTFTLGRDHAATEQRIADSGMRWTFLRDNLYADLMPSFADEAGVIRGPAGEGRVGLVAIADVAAVAAVVLRDPKAHEAAAYSLTGPEPLTLSEVAATIAEVLGRPTSFVDETIEEAYASRARYGAEQWQLDAWVSTYVAIARSEMASVTDDVPRLIGRPALSLRDVLRTQRAAAGG